MMNLPEEAAEIFWSPREPPSPKALERPRRVEYHGQRLTLKEAAEQTGLAVCTIHQRLAKGDTDEEALRPRLATYRPKTADWETGPTPYQVTRIARAMAEGERLTLAEFQDVAKISSDAQVARIVRDLVRLQLIRETENGIESTPKGIRHWQEELWHARRRQWPR